MDGKTRCSWCDDDELYRRYHDEEWGVATRDERALFESLILEGAQAGLSWITILRKREGYRRAFAAFDPEKIARFDEEDFERLVSDPGIVRNRLKIRSTIGNARAYLELREEGTTLAELLWSFVDGEVVVNRWSSLSELPAQTDASTLMSKELKRRGFRFVGPTICYALMQAAGLVNDHVIDCFRYAEVGAEER